MGSRHKGRRDLLRSRLACRSCAIRSTCHACMHVCVLVHVGCRCSGVLSRSSGEQPSPFGCLSPGCGPTSEAALFLSVIGAHVVAIVWRHLGFAEFVRGLGCLWPGGLRRRLLLFPGALVWPGGVASLSGAYLVLLGAQRALGELPPFCRDWRPPGLRCTLFAPAPCCTTAVSSSGILSRSQPLAWGLRSSHVGLVVFPWRPCGLARLGGCMCVGLLLPVCLVGARRPSGLASFLRMLRIAAMMCVFVAVVAWSLARSVCRLRPDAWLTL